jgi:hypothetical protein
MGGEVMAPQDLLRRHDDGTNAAYVVLGPGPDYVIEAVSKTYEQLTMQTAAELVGRGVFEAFPDDPNNPNADGVAKLRASLERAEATGQPDEMKAVRYDIERPPELGGGWAVRYWQVVNTPQVKDGKLHFIHFVQDVTQRVINEHLRVETAQVAQDLRRARLEARIAYMLVVMIAVYGAFLSGDVQDIARKNSNLIRAQGEQALARCAATSAVIEAGRNTITAQTKSPADPKQERGLRALGFPPKPQRDALARAQAQAYAQFIRNRVEEETGKKLLVNKDGSLNCKKLAPGAKR